MTEPMIESAFVIPAETSFEAALRELDARVRELETESLPLAEALKAFQHSQALIQHCESQLMAAETQLVKVLQQNPNTAHWELQPFESEPTGAHS